MHLVRQSQGLPHEAFHVAKKPAICLILVIRPFLNKIRMSWIYQQLNPLGVGLTRVSIQSYIKQEEEGEEEED